MNGGASYHRNSYPAYAVGGLDGATGMVYLFGRISLAVSELAHQAVKGVLLVMCFYCNKLNFPLSVSGRHPNGQGKLVPMHYAMMTITETPDGRGDFDKEIASVYLRLISSDSSSAERASGYTPRVSNAQERKIAKRLMENSFRAESDPRGSPSLDYGCVSVQRREN